MLLNVDIKNLSRLMTHRIEKTISNLIGPQQLAFIKGRNISEGNRLIEYVQNFCNVQNTPGFIVAIDFAKAFDSVDHEYLESALRAFGFTEKYINMVKLLYKNAESAVMNNGLTTKYFLLGRSCRQGDSLSPFLFILAIEPLLLKIRNDPLVRGIKGPKAPVKESAFADDLTLTLKDLASINVVGQTLKRFEELGLRSGCKPGKM